MRSGTWCFAANTKCLLIRVSAARELEHRIVTSTGLLKNVSFCLGSFSSIIFNQHNDPLVSRSLKPIVYFTTSSIKDSPKPCRDVITWCSLCFDCSSTIKISVCNLRCTFRMLSAIVPRILMSCLRYTDESYIACIPCYLSGSLTRTLLKQRWKFFENELNKRANKNESHDTVSGSMQTIQYLLMIKTIPFSSPLLFTLESQ